MKRDTNYKEAYDMKISVQKIGDVAIIELKNDFYKTKLMNSSVSSVLQISDKLVLDMANVNLIDSRGCGVLLTFLKTVAKTGGNIKLCSVQKSVLTVFELVRLHRIIEIFNTPEEAVQSFDN